MSSPYEPFGSQNPHDDDGQVLDSFFIETDTPPPLKDATEPIPAPAIKLIPRATRLLSRSMTFSSTQVWSAWEAFPGDVNRKGFGFRVSGTNATDGVRVASDLGDLYTGGRVFTGQSLTDVLSSHTGPVYILPFGAAANGQPTADVSIEMWVVTL